MEFNEVPGRTHPNIGSIPKDPISVLNFADLNMWLIEQKKSWINLYSVRRFHVMVTFSKEQRPSLGYTFFFFLFKKNYLCNYNSNPVKLLIAKTSQQTSIIAAGYLHENNNNFYK